MPPTIPNTLSNDSQPLEVTVVLLNEHDLIPGSKGIAAVFLLNDIHSAFHNSAIPTKTICRELTSTFLLNAAKLIYKIS